MSPHNNGTGNYTSVNPNTRVIFLVFGPLVLLSGVLGNGFLLLVLTSQRHLRQVHNVFIANLALSDLLVMLCGLLFLLVDLILERNSFKGWNPACSFMGIALCVAYTVSLLSLVSVSLHRYLKVCHTSLCHKLFTVSKTFAICVLFWVLALLLNAVLFWAFEMHGYDTKSHICNARGGRNPQHGSTVVAIFLVVPVVLIGSFCISIFRTFRHSKKTMSKNQKRGRRKKNSKTKVKLACNFENGRSTGSRNIVINIAIDTNSVTDVVTETGTRNRARPATPWPVRKIGDGGLTTRSIPLLNVNQTFPRKSFRTKGKRRGRRTKYPDLDGPKTKYPKLTDTGIGLASILGRDDNSSSSAAMGIPITTFCETPFVSHTSMQETEIDNSFRDTEVEVKTTAKTDIIRTRASSVRPKVSYQAALVRSLIAISVCVTLFCTPLAVCVIADAIPGFEIPTEVMVTAWMLLFVNSAVNWIIYGIMNTTFQRAYLKMARSCLYGRLRCC